MAIIALVSAKGSPGVTTTALACALSWHRRLVLAECDPAGGSILAGYLGGALDGPRGIGELAVGRAARRQPGDRRSGPSWSTWTRRAGNGCCCPAWSTRRRPAASPRSGSGSPTSSARLERGDPRLRRARRLWPAAGRRPAVAAAAGRRRGAAGDPGAAARPVRHPGRWSGPSNGTSPSTGCRRAPCGCCWSATGTARAEISQALRLPVIARLPHDPRTAEVLGLGGTVRGRTAADARGRPRWRCRSGAAGPPAGPAGLAGRTHGGAGCGLSRSPHDPRAPPPGATSTVPPLPPPNGRHHRRRRRRRRPRRSARRRAGAAAPAPGGLRGGPRAAPGAERTAHPVAARPGVHRRRGGRRAGPAGRRGGRRVRRRGPPGRHPDGRRRRNGCCSTR